MTLPPVAGDEVESWAVAMPTPVLANELSMMVMEPTPWLLAPPDDMSMPVWQLLIDSPEKVNVLYDDQYHNQRWRVRMKFTSPRAE